MLSNAHRSHRKKGLPGLRAPGFSLTETLIVIVIIAVLVALLFPIAGRMRDTARGSKCAQNLRQIGVGLLAYISENNGRFPNGQLDVSWTRDPVTRQLLGTCWYDAATQYMGRNTVSMRFNDPRADPMPECFGCPSGHGKAYHPAWPYTGDYAANIRLGRQTPDGVASISAVDKPESTPYVQDTVMQNQFGEWIYGGGFSKTAAPAFAPRHAGKGNILWVDGHVSSFSHEEYMKFANAPQRGGASNFIQGKW